MNQPEGRRAVCRSGCFFRDRVLVRADDGVHHVLVQDDVSPVIAHAEVVAVAQRTRHVAIDEVDHVLQTGTVYARVYCPLSLAPLMPREDGAPSESA